MYIDSLTAFGSQILGSNGLICVSGGEQKTENEAKYDINKKINHIVAKANINIAGHYRSHKRLHKIQ